MWFEKFFNLPKVRAQEAEAEAEEELVDPQQELRVRGNITSKM